ncbi:MAG: outer membrane beta-barrel family protein [Muribaculaceae bacterium]|nr:outer membrane beta-barrel family protein [Muribaculaceae bacterium]
MRGKESDADAGGTVTTDTIAIGKTIELEEVEVVASKLKMVMNGDTIVYNADAFNLSEGSMLDKLVELLPGVKINDKGQITVNGEYVSSLLINGKDFFSGNPGVALMNLPAYTVNKVKVYHKEGKDAYLRDRTEAERKKDPIVMDVNLKKRFLGSYMANVDVAGGTSKRFSLRSFVAGFDNETNFGIYGNLNNVGMRSDPTQNESIWDAENQENGDNIYRGAGISFSNYGNQEKRIIYVNANGNSNTLNNNSLTTSQGYLPPDYNYISRSLMNNHTVSGSLSLDGSLSLQMKGFYSSTACNVNFDRNKGENKTITKKNRGEELIEDLDKDEERFINSFHRISSVSSNSYSLGGSQHFSVRMPYNADMLTLNFSGNYQHSKSSDWNVSNNISKENITILNDYINNPSHNADFNASAVYEHRFKWGLSLHPSYEMKLRDYRNERGLYQYLPDSIMTSLPVVTDTLTLISDVRQSFIATTTSLQQRVRLNADFKIGKVAFNVSLPYTWKRELMKDTRAESLRRVTKSFDPSAMVSWKNFRVQYSLLTTSPGAQQLLDFTDDSNLMTVRKGNPNLRNSKQHYTSIGFSCYNFENDMNFSAQASYSETKDAIVNALSFNPENGVSTIMAYNVDGNRNLWSNIEYGFNFGHRKRFRLDVEVSASHNRSVAFSSTGTPDFARSIVRSTHFDPVFKIGYLSNKFNITGRFVGKGLWTRGNLESFVKTDLFDGSMGLSGWVKLPFGFQIESSLVYSIESGYADPSMNRNQLFWKASAQKVFGKGGAWTVRLDGFDILGQLSGVSRSVNAQGITETRRSLLGRYVLLHLQYNFNFVRSKRM